MTDEFNPAAHVISIRGKGGNAVYLPAKYRAIWFRKEHHAGSITTELVRLDERLALFKATASFPTPWARGDEAPLETVWVTTTGFGSETAADFPDYIEKAETKAIGRALSLAGYGTEQSLEEDASRPADAPVDRARAKATANQLTQIKDLTKALGAEETIGQHLQARFRVSESSELSQDQANSLITDMRRSLAERQKGSAS
jgi:hypothetical protein